MSAHTSAPVELNADVGEFVPPGEEAAAAAVLGMLETVVRNAYDKTNPKLARRDAHAKAHGVVKATFKVLDNLPPDLKVGIFAEPATFDAWIRYSNGNTTPQADSVGDGRGMAIKLMNVPGSPSTTQDFLMINFPAFFCRNAPDYVIFQKNPMKFFFSFWNPIKFRLKEAWVAFSIARQTVRNPLNIRYWSMTPYLFGDFACKFSAKPRDPLSKFTGSAGPNFLRDNMAAQLAEGGVTFDFMVQRRTNPATMPVEDPTVTWSETESPFVPIATITIPQQIFDTPAQNTFAENLTYTPWHCIPAHRPLGGINRLRKVVYDGISRLRHELNHVVRKEPTDFSM
jgi:hypothetical protein